MPADETAMPADETAPTGGTHPTGPARRPLPPIPPPPLLSGALITSVIMQLVTFVLSFELESELFRNGVRVSCSYIDLAALLLGPLGAAFAVQAIRESGRPYRIQRRRRELTVAAACLAVAVVHVLRGLGVIEVIVDNNPCR